MYVENKNLKREDRKTSEFYNKGCVYVHLLGVFRQQPEYDFDVLFNIFQSTFAMFM